jgi:hypothetical protein
LVVSHLDIGGEDADLEVRGAGGEKDVVGVPVHRRHSRLQRLLDVLRHPPVVLLVEVAYGDNPRSRTLKVEKNLAFVTKGKCSGRLNQKPE